MNHPAKLVAVSALVATGIFASIPAHAECFLKIDGVKGESTDSRHGGAIEIGNWSWGVTQSGSAHVGTGGGSGSSDIGDVRLSKLMDQTSPILAQSSVKGTAVKSAVLSCRSNPKSADYVTVTLSTLFISSYKITVDKERPTEEVTLHFSKIKIEHRLIKPDGSVGATVTFSN